MPIMLKGDMQEIKAKIRPIQDIAIILTGTAEFVCEKEC